MGRFRFGFVWLALCWVLGAMAAPAAAAGFSCDKAVTVDEILICEDDDLSNMDEKLNADYQDLKQALPPDEVEILRNNQRQWIARRNLGCGIDKKTTITSANRAALTECLFTSYAEREVFLADLLQVMEESQKEQNTDDSVANDGSSIDKQSNAESADNTDDKDAGSEGTGFVIAADNSGADDLIVTNQHVIDGCKKLSAGNGDLGVVDAHVVAADKDMDLALVGAKLDAKMALPLRTEATEPGEDVVVLGYPLYGVSTTGLTVTTGIVSATSGMSESSYVQISAPVQPGNSGGPLMDRSGAVVGIVAAQLDALMMGQVIGSIPQNVNFAIRLDRLRHFLDAHGAHYKSIQSGSEMKTNALVAAARPAVILLRCEGGA